MFKKLLGTIRDKFYLDNAETVGIEKDGGGNLVLRDGVVTNGSRTLSGLERNAYEAASNPTADNDGVDTASIGRAFQISESWINTTADTVYVCVDNATGAAVWKKTPQTASDVGAEPAFAKNTAFNKNFGSSAGEVCQGNDSRLSDARTPTAHKTSHQSGGSDAIKLDDLSAPDDNTDLNASTSKHGLLLKLGGGTTNFLRADGTWAAPPSGSGYTYTVADLTALNALTGESAGETAWMTTAPDGNGKAWYFNGTTWQVLGETVETTNKSGTTLAYGKVVVVDSANDDACTRVSTGFQTNVIGPIVIGGANNARVVVAVCNKWDVYYNESVSAGEYCRTSATIGEAAGDASPNAGMFGQVVESTGGSGVALTMLFPKEMY